MALLVMELSLPALNTDMVITCLKNTHQMGASRRRNPGLKVELNPLDCWAAGPCSVLVDYVDFGSLATG